MKIVFGSFKGLCEIAPLPLCRLVEGNYANGPKCYSRSIDTQTFVIFQPATLALEMVSLIMTVFMIIHIRTKYTAIGRREISLFFYIYVLEIILEIIVVSGVIPTRLPLYRYFVAAHLSVISAAVFCLLLNGFVGFHFVEDGTVLSVWFIRIFSLATGGISFCLSMGTFNSIVLNAKKPVLLWIWIYVVHSAAILLYGVMQIVLVFRTLDDLWPLGNIILGLGFFFLGQVTLNLLSTQICHGASHYIDGLFFACLCSLLSVMMVYKYWDSLTKDDLEFVVTGGRKQWEITDLPDENMSDLFDTSGCLTDFAYNNGTHNTTR
ncbi:Chitin synthase, class 7 [Entomophthora muscae]|uniref:Chitin synthase, class 7 n=2 Tax=Entomophthora muscae TaxID=34485 RepID=A0ACC2SVY6_9FUNG|nr:Chitin synthase, class 7 [Entomophthora muscae]